jgi:adenosylhomocysteine nucleosidase
MTSPDAKLPARATPPDLRADVLLVTAVPCELKAIKSAAKSLDLRWDRQHGEVTEYRNLGLVGDLRVVAIQLGSMGSFSAAGSAFTCYRAMIETRATSVLAVGIAFGIDESRQQEGDVLVSEVLHLYDEVDVIDEGDSYRYAYPERAVVRASERWVERFQRSVTTLPAMATPPREVHVGRLLAGGARIESRAFRAELVARVGDGDPPVVGGEMEAAGIAAACAATNAEWIVVKAVSDFATRESRLRIAEHRDKAASAAALFVLETLRSGW